MTDKPRGTKPVWWSKRYIAYLATPPEREHRRQERQEERNPNNPPQRPCPTPKLDNPPRRPPPTPDLGGRETPWRRRTPRHQAGKVRPGPRVPRVHVLVPRLRIDCRGRAWRRVERGALAGSLFEGQGLLVRHGLRSVIFRVGRRWEGGKEVRGGDDDARRSCSSGPQAGCGGCILGVQFPVFALCLLLLPWSCAIYLLEAYSSVVCIGNREICVSKGTCLWIPYDSTGRSKRLRRPHEIHQHYAP